MKQRRFLMICFAVLLCLGMASLSSVAYAALPAAYNGGDIEGRLIQTGDDQTFLQGGAASTICIDMSKMVNPVFESLKSGFQKDSTYAGTSVYYSGTALAMNADNVFSGDCFKNTFVDGAILADGSRADVVIIYSDVHFFTPPTSYNGQTFSGYGANVKTFVANDGTKVRSGNDLLTAPHVGLQVSVTFKIVDKQGRPVDGQFWYTMNDIDIVRDGSANYGALNSSSSYNTFSEQVVINGGALSEVYIPGNGQYKCGITADSSGSNGNGILFTPSASDGDTFYSGFGVLADARDGISLTVRSAAGKRQSVDTDLLPEAVGALYAEKNVDTTGATPTDLTRNWSVETTISGQTATESIGNGQIKHVGNFIKGKAFTFKEADPDLANYETTYEVLNGSSLTNQTTQSSGSGVTANGTMVCVNTVKFTNKRLWQNLTIGKEVRGARGDRTKQWKFTLTVKDSPQNGGAPLTGATLFDGVDGRPSALPAGWTEEGNGVFTFDLAHNGTTTISLPKGCQYTITEEIDPYYLQTGSASGTLSSYTTETLVNDFQGKILAVSKTVEAGDRTRAWQYTLTLLNPSGEPYTTLTAETLGYTGDGWDDSGKANGVYKFTLKHGESGTFTLPVDSQYTVTEESDERYTQTHVIDSGATVTGVSTGSQTLSDDATVAYNNRKDKMNLTVSKAVDGSIGSRSKYFKVVITVANAGDTVMELDMSQAETSGITQNAVTTYTVDEMIAVNARDDDTGNSGQQVITANGEAAITVYIRHGQSVTLKDVPVGAAYTVTELPQGYTPSLALTGDQKTGDAGGNAGSDIPTGDRVASAEDTYMLDDAQLDWTNTLEAEVPTGVYTSVAPAALSIAMALSLLALTRLGRRKKTN